MKTDTQFREEIYRRKALCVKKRQARVVALSSALAGVILCLLTVVLIQDFTPATPPSDGVESSTQTGTVGSPSTGYFDTQNTQIRPSGSNGDTDSASGEHGMPENYVIVSGENIVEEGVVSQLFQTIAQYAPPSEGTWGTSTEPPRTSNTPDDTSAPPITDTGAGPTDGNVDCFDGGSYTTQNPTVDSPAGGPEAWTEIILVSGGHFRTYFVSKTAIRTGSVEYPITEDVYDQLIALLG